MATMMRRTVIQIAQPAKDARNAESYTSQSVSREILNDAYLYNGEPINNLSQPGQLIPNVQRLESAAAAAALAKKYPPQSKFVGHKIVNDNRTSWTGR